MDMEVTGKMVEKKYVMVINIARQAESAQFRLYGESYNATIAEQGHSVTEDVMEHTVEQYGGKEHSVVEIIGGTH